MGPPVMGRGAVVALLLAALLLSGCGLLVRGPAPAPPDPTSDPTDAPVPSSMAFAVTSAREALTAGWVADGPVAFRFAQARCAIGAGAVVVFHQLVDGQRPAWALALTHDLAAAAIFGSWSLRYDVPDPAADGDLRRLLGTAEIACP